MRETGDLERLDLALLISDEPCPQRVCSRSTMCAAPVKPVKQLAQSADKIGGCVSNSGNANAATGEQGMKDAKQMNTLAQLETGIGSLPRLLHRPDRPKAADAKN